MTIDPDSDAHDHPLLETAGSVSRAGAGLWWGLAAFVLSGVVIIGGIAAQIIGPTSFNVGSGSTAGFGERLVALASDLRIAAPFVALAALLLDDETGRKLAQWALGLWVVALVLTAILTQRGFSTL